MGSRHNMQKLSLRLIALSISFCGALLLVAVGVSPQAADLNATLWLKALGWQHPPTSLLSTAAQSSIRAAAWFLITLGALTLLEWMFSFKDRSPAVRSNRYLSARDAVHYLLDETKWVWAVRRIRKPGIVHGREVEMQLNAALEAIGEFQKEASKEDSSLKVYGLQFGSAQAELIPHTFWMNNGLDARQVYAAGVDCETVPTVWAANGHVKYGKLQIDRAGMQKAWPKLSPILRIYLRWQMWRQTAF